MNELKAYYLGFMVGSRVQIKDAKDIHGVVTSVCFRDNAYVQYEVAWFANGQQQTQWFDYFRLEAKQ